MPAVADRLPSLDGLRGVAVSMVVLFHVGQGAAAMPLLQQATSLGAHGVDLFLVLSGFLITGILLETRGQPGYFRSFYARRVLRIFPAYYLYLALLAVVLTLTPAAHVSRDAFARGWPWYALFLTNIKIIYFFDLDPASVQHLWSLAVEEHYYLVWPAVLAIVPASALLPFTCAAVVAVALGRTLWLAAGAEPVAAYMLSWSRADALLVGGALALLRANVRVWPKAVRAAPLVAAGALAASFVAAEGLRYSCIALFFGAIIASCVANDERGSPLAILCSPMMRRLGEISYGVYLFHFFFSLRLGGVVREALGSGLLGFLATLAAVSLSTWLLAELSYRYLETPVLALKRFVPRPVSGPC